MKAVVGVDSKENYQPVMALLAKLAFPISSTSLVHVADPNLPFSYSEWIDAGMQADYARATHDQGLTVLDRANHLALESNLQPKLKLIFGQPAGMLISEAENELADIVAVCAGQHGMWSTSYIGSVSRALAISCRSTVLIAKGPIRNVGPLNAVFATDHSSFADACLTRFLHLNPRGIKRIHVVSSFKIDERESKLLNLKFPEIGADFANCVQERVECNNSRVCEKLSAAGYETSSTAVQGNANDVIRQAMQNTRSDLVIVGSQGNGYSDRAVIGSVSLHQVVAEPYPVLIVRP